ncbi:MAG TPA: ABC transporter ATP-binding protein [Actinocrinis sp.]|uniref:ABC transporter ATP-binding protein n=1 Tax=Actinocrinis sp. TaxID=1920516 RepID=UPI002D2EFCBE|nr:ABC transporter ATP-binding protein [Actinocrinis sp.]HZU58918.1 ABC transporter ATP-binding protein [Actinocrinis sp.]
MTTLSETSSPAGGAAEVVLEAEDLTKHFPVRRQLRAAFSGERTVVHAVDDVTLLLRRGRVTALVGESGSGKSTVARLLAQLYPRTGGAIRLHGTETTVRGGRKFRAYSGRVQMIFQDPFASLNPVHTVRYHLTRALRVHNRVGRGREETEAALADLLTKVQLTPPERYIDKFPHELSGGQRQRVAIARALAAGPEALLADEPVSMLDVSIRLGILNLLRDLKEQMHLAILYITHDIASARYFADETQVMYAGRIVEGGDSESVTQQPAHPYTRLLINSAPDPDRIASHANGSALNGSAQNGSALNGSASPADEPSVDEGTGEVASLIHPPSGCRFHPRCPHAMDVCTVQVPPRFTVGGPASQSAEPAGSADSANPTHWAACWLYSPEHADGGAHTNGEAGAAA